MEHIYTQITLDSQGVATLTLNRPELHNAFNDAMITELIAALKLLSENNHVRVLVLNANGKNFSAGADLNWMRSMAQKDYGENLQDASELATLMYKLDKFPKPTLAVVQGAAFGGALGLIACCDIAIASESASFCLSEVKVGLVPAVISPYVMRAIGERASRRYFLTAEKFDASTAKQLGLLHDISSTDELNTLKTYFITQLLQNSPMAQVAAKELISNNFNRKINNKLIVETEHAIARIRVSPEGQEGLSAFLAKRAPIWQTPHYANSSTEK